MKIETAIVQTCRAVFFICLLWSCKKENGSKPATGSPFIFVKGTINDSPLNSQSNYNVAINPIIKISFSSPVNPSSVPGNTAFTSGNNILPVNYSYANNDSTVIIQPAAALQALTSYSLSILTSVRSATDSSLKNPVRITLITQIDSTPKFSQISDSALLTLVEQQTFNYFWNFGHPFSGMARERTSSGDIVTTGGSGFGVMSMLVGVQRGFISRESALGRIDTIVNYLTNDVTRYHGAFAHWTNGSNGATVPFDTQDDGADIVETSYMLQGLLCARQFFNSNTDSGEINLRSNINNLYNGVQWNWFRQNGQNVLYWNWSPDYGFAINVQVRGW